MTRLALGFSSRDRVELSRRSIEPLLHPDIKLLWADGSTTEEGKDFFAELLPLPAGIDGHNIIKFSNVRGGSDTAVVFLMTKLLETDCEYLGLVENDVLLDADWLEPTLELFEKGKQDGLEVGAVSARCYEDRILIQRDHYAVAHNHGAGMVIFTRPALQLVLDRFRSNWTTENRVLFHQLSGIDIGQYWAFRGSEHWLTTDWGFDRELAQHGYASLALTPAHCRMIGQVPPLAEQGLTLATGPVERFRNDKAFDLYVKRTAQIRESTWWPGANHPTRHHSAHNGWMIFPHQVSAMGGVYEGDWWLRWSQGFGPFTWRAGTTDKYPQAHDRDQPVLRLPVSGPCDLFLGGGETGGQVEIVDEDSRFRCAPVLLSEGSDVQILPVSVPGSVQHRVIRLTALSPGVTFYGLRTREPQPWLPQVRFSHATLPPA